MFHKPEFVLLDEFSSSVDQETEEKMYERLNEIKISYLSIAHRDTVKKFHQIELNILKDGNCKIIKIN